MCEMGERQVGRVAAELLDGFSAEERAQFEEYMRRVAGTWSAPCARKRPRGRPAVKKNQTI